MSKAPAPSSVQPSREERLAAKLRENLRRRKAQARELDPLAETGGEPLPKPPPSR